MSFDIHTIVSFAPAISFLALIVFGRSYKYYLELFKHTWFFSSIKLWYAVGIALAAVSQYFLLQATSDPLVVAVVNGIALYVAYIQICRD